MTVYDRAYFLHSKEARGHRPRLQLRFGLIHSFYDRPAFIVSFDSLRMQTVAAIADRIRSRSSPPVG